MGRLPEYDHVEREALRKGISRQPDPLPRGAVVAGEPRELEVTTPPLEITDGLTFAALRRENVARCEAVFHPLESWSYTDWMTAVAGEVGEAANLIKKRRRLEQIPDEEIGKELADAVIYLDLLAARLGLDLGVAVARKFDEVSYRKGWDGPRLSGNETTSLQVERRLKESALARVRELEAAVAEMGARLERVRGVVGAAVKMAQATDLVMPHDIPGDKEAWKSILDVEKFVDALTPEDRAWAEGEE